MADEKVAAEKERVQTAADVDQTLGRLRKWVGEAQLWQGYTIEDYPIGRTARGRCRLEVEAKKGLGFRTVKTTTDKHGRWCKPHKSTFRSSVLLVVTHPEFGEREAGWLQVGVDGAGVYFANGDRLTLAEPPCRFPPNRKEQRFKIVTRTAMMGQAEAPKVEETEHVRKADDPALCDAWDAWARDVVKLARELLVRGGNATPTGAAV